MAVALVQAFLVKPFGVPSQSMEQTLHIGDRILVNRLDHDIVHGDVVVFGHGNTWQEEQVPPADNVVMRALRTFGDLTGIGPSNTAYTVKRVIGLPGQTVACCSTDGRVTVDGRPLDEPYIYEDLPVHRRHARLLELAAVDPVLPRDHRAERQPPGDGRPPLGVGRLGHRLPRRHRGAGVRPVRAARTAWSGRSCCASGRSATSAPPSPTEADVPPMQCGTCARQGSRSPHSPRMHYQAVAATSRMRWETTVVTPSPRIDTP